MDITLALGGGGMRGVAHIGVLRALEREDFHVRAVAGTSFGAIVAAFYAAGFTPDEMEHFAGDLNQPWLDGWPFSDGPGLFGVRKITALLKIHFGDKTFDDLNLPCAVIAVDLKSNREIVLQEGPVMDALLGSIAFPGLFPPQEMGRYSLIDGGTLDPVPVRAARALAPGLPVVAVTLLTPLEQPFTPPMLQISPSGLLANQLARLNITQAFSIFANAVDIGQRQMSELRLKVDAPEVLIHPDVDNINLLDKINVADVAKRGERAMQATLPELRRAVSWSARVRHSLGL
jgi:NTE family protein